MRRSLLPTPAGVRIKGKPSRRFRKKLREVFSRYRKIPSCSFLLPPWFPQQDQRYTPFILVMARITHFPRTPGVPQAILARAFSSRNAQVRIRSSAPPRLGTTLFIPPTRIRCPAQSLDRSTGVFSVPGFSLRSFLPPGQMPDRAQRFLRQFSGWKIFQTVPVRAAEQSPWKRIPCPAGSPAR